MPKIKSARTASHAGSWYESNGKLLSAEIQQWMQNVALEEQAEKGHVRAVIAPHAGLSYCGHVMAYAYRYIIPAKVKRVFLLGPSHHFYSRECHLSPHTRYSSPLGDAIIDTEVYKALQATGKFQLMQSSADEAEHSLELHLPFLMAAMRSSDFTLVPIVVGALTPEGEAAYGKILAPYLEDSANFFIISSDFCHWGTRFNYTFYQSSQGDIHDSIRWLDHEGMRIIEGGDPAAFTKYLKIYGNTICGRHPISVFLQAARASSLQHCIEFTKYDQSHTCLTQRDSSVSYASATVRLAVAEEDGEEDEGDALP